LLNPYKKTKEDASEEPEDDEINYEELDLSEGIEQGDYGIVFGVEHDDLEEETLRI
jgi:hypothetical protein